MDVDLLVEEFEAAWATGVRPSIQEFVRRSDGDHRSEVVCALVRVDLHWQWSQFASNPTRATDTTETLKSEHFPPNNHLLRPPRIEDYLDEFPLLCDCDEFPYDLLGDELLARLSAYDNPSTSELSTRFPNADQDRLRHVFSSMQEYYHEHSVGHDPVGSHSSLIGDRFIVRSQIGSGGMGRVYLALEKRLDRLVAIKIPLFDLRADTVALERLRREGRAAGGICHPNVVSVYEVIEAKNECAIVSEYIDGPSLKEWLRSAKTPIAPRVAARLLLKIARGVQAAHDRGVVHRDLKPSNILLELVDVHRNSPPNDDETTVSVDETVLRPRITDFGLAHFYDSDSTLTGTGAMLGTAGYMSPEHINGKPAGRHSDVFALGVILHETLAGEPPFAADTYALSIDLVLHHDPPPVHKLRRDVPRNLGAICERALQKEPQHRYASAGAFADDLHRFLSHEPVAARPIGPAGRAMRWCVRNRLAATLACVICVALIGSLWQNHQLGNAIAQVESERIATRESRIHGIMNAIRNAETRNVPVLIAELSPHLEMAVTTLANQFDASESETEKVNVAMSLVSHDPVYVKYLADRLLDLPPSDVSAACDILTPFKSDLALRYWEILEHTTNDGALRAGPRGSARILSAASALAAFDPDSEKWNRESIASIVAFHLLNENPLHSAAWIQLLEPIAPFLNDPLVAVFRNWDGTHSQVEVRMATTILGYFCRDTPNMLLDLILDANPSQFTAFFETCQVFPETAQSHLRRSLLALQQEPLAFDDTITARRHANATIALLRLGDVDVAMQSLKLEPNPTVRTRIIHQVSALNVPPSIFIDRLSSEKDVAIRRAMILCLGELADRITDNEKQQMQATLLSMYETDPDCGVHGACFWALQQLKSDSTIRDRLVQIDNRLETGKPEGLRNWYRTRHDGHTFAIIKGPVEFEIGSSPDTDHFRDRDEDPRWKRIDRTFAIGTAEVSMKQFQPFVETAPPTIHKPFHYAGYTPADDLPQISVNWYVAANFCNWLSEMEGIPKEQWCYPDLIAAGMQMPEDYLSRTGYRLPTECEWEFACRAGSTTTRHFGQDLVFFDRYAWHIDSARDRPHPVARLKPNDHGLFDLYGNAMEWCQSGAEVSLPDQLDDVESHFLVTDKDIDSRVLRGGSFATNSRYTRTAYRQAFSTVAAGVELGIRVARTMPPDRLP